MFFIVLVLNVILVSGLFAIDPGYYTDTKIMGEEVYFPKSDTEYIDYLTEKGGSEAYYELAIAHLKLERKDIAEKYIKLYKKEDGDSKKLLNYYRLSDNFVELEKLLEEILDEVDEDTKIKYKILIENEAKEKNLPIDLEKYKVSDIEKLYTLRNNEEKFKKYFNSEEWTRSEMIEFLELLRYQEIPKGGSVEKLFEMFATDRDKLQKKYLEIKDTKDKAGYNVYFSYAEELGLTPEIKSETEKNHYLRYKGEVIEVENVDVKIDTDTDPRLEDDELASARTVEEHEQDIKAGKLNRLNEYIDLLKKSGITDIESKLKTLTREADVVYRLDRGLSIEEGDRGLAATYLFEKNDLVNLDKYKDSLSEEQLGILGRINKEYKEYYRRKYPLNNENIDRRRLEYFYFAKTPKINKIMVEQLLSKRHLEPQERYYLSVYYHQKMDYVKSYRETEQLFRRYQLSNEIFNLHAKNIEKLKKAETETEEDTVDVSLSKEL